MNPQRKDEQELSKLPREVAMINVLIDRHEEAAVRSNRDCRLTKKSSITNPSISFGTPMISFGNTSILNKQTNVGQSNAPEQSQ